MIPPRSLALFLVFAVFPQAVTDVVPSSFPISAWEKQKEVTQIPWAFNVGDPYIRSDLRQELNLSVTIRADELRKAGENHGIVLYVRALERGRPVGSVHSAPIPFPTSATTVVSFNQRAIVRPGRYRLEVALLDRATGRYNIQFENVTIEGDENPVERAFRSFGKFEFVPQPDRDPPEESVWVPLPERIRVGSIVAPTAELVRSRPAVLTGWSLGFTEDRPSFVVDKRNTTLSVITILSPPEEIVADPQLVELFKQNLSHLLSVVLRLEVPNGAAKLSGVDLVERTRVFDQVDLKDVTPEMLDHALTKDTRTISLDALSRTIDQATLFRDVLRERLTDAERDISGAQHVILVDSASSKSPNGSGLTIPRARECHCQVYYVRFALDPNGTDDIDDMIKEYKPQVFQPITWREFREDFGKIYGQLLR